MTITLQAVNELIASLESAGELSIKETKVMALAKAYQQLAAENVALKALIPENWQMHDVLHQLIVARPGGVYFNKWEKLIIGVLNETPATDRIVAGIKADGVEEFAAYQRAITEEWACKEGHSSLLKVAESAELFAKQLREGADK
ncbi:hypothetical protein FHC47_11550 [Klebsiella quasipneumoniae]|uniref:hypothetical protein n=1 Tax=Klebsiella quasipneumoniae TaxID=1463165 RepID=UPI001111F997|nr:hypothetical protein [Klebsiella quasipneumoniae]TNC55917.1 hypothetical protein FHC47_11550 [Klebsiella quasipneumoniae]